MVQFGEDVKTGYFSVTYMTEVGQMRCVPQVCYKLDDEVRVAVEKMVKDGLARVYDEEVRFISGTPVPLKKPAPSHTMATVAGSTVAHEGPQIPQQVIQPGRHSGKTGRNKARTFN